MDTSRRRRLLSSNREQPLTHSLIRIVLTLLLPTKNICLFNQSLLNALHLLSAREDGLAFPKCVHWGFMRWGHRLCQYCQRVTALGTAHRLLSKWASLSMVNKESSQGQFASDQGLCIGIA